MITDVEKAIASWVIEKLQVMIDIYLGTFSTKGEVLTRNIGLYEKTTFKKHLDYYAYKFLRERDVQLQQWGRLHLSETEISSILEIVGLQITEWTKEWESFVKRNPSVRISDLAGKRSKAIPWIGMSYDIWKKSKELILDIFKNEFKTKYSGYCIYPYFNPGQKELLQMQWPKLKFASIEDIKAEVMIRLSGELDKNVDDNMISVYVDFVLDSLYDVADTTVQDSLIKSRHKDIIKQKQQDFIDYVTQQVFGSQGYLYGSNRENVNTAISQKEQPGISDFIKLLDIRAVTEAYTKLNLVDDKGFIYNRDDLTEVIELNKKVVHELAEPEYIATLIENDIIVDDTEKDEAFNYRIPTFEEIEDIDKELSQRVDDILQRVDKSVYDTFDNDDLIDWYKNITDYGDTLSVEKNVDKSFVEPVVEAACNVLGAATAKKVTTPLKITSTYKTSNSTRSNNRITGWKRYYPSGYSDTERVSDWRRYYPGVDDDSQRLLNRTDDFQRYYPYTPSEEPRVYDWKRYYPSNVSEDTRVSDWQRYYPGKGKVASDFLPTYRTFSGQDMVVSVQLPLSSKNSLSKVIGAFETITYSIHNEKAPVRVLGDMNVRRYVFGPRVIAGSLSLIVFDRHWMRELLDQYIKIKSETERYFLMDELPAMNITISCVNEYGYNAKLAIYGVTIINEGQIMSINDLYTENTYEFVAMNVDYLDRVESTIAQRRNKALDNIPYDDSNPSSETKTTEESETTKPETEPIVEVGTEDPDKADAPPQVVDAYNPDLKKWKDKYEEILEKYKNGKLTQKKALKKINSIEKDERKERFNQWKRDVYTPKLRTMLKKFGVNESETSNMEKLKDKLGAEYEDFISAYNAFLESYNHSQQLIWESTGNEATGYRDTVLKTNVINTIDEEPDQQEEENEIIEINFEDSDNGIPYYVDEPFTDKEVF